MKNVKELTTEELLQILEEVKTEIENREMQELQDDVFKIENQMGYVDQRDLSYEDHRRGTNYIATVSFNPASPGNLDRDFWGKGSGSFRAIPDSLKEKNVIEVAHDYTSGGGNKSRRRDYYMIVKITDDALFLTETEKPESL